MRRCWSLLIVLMLIGPIPLASTVDSESPSQFGLNNERYTDVIVLDLESAKSESLSPPDHVISGNSTLISLDIEGDGYPEILYCSRDGEIIKYSTKGDSYSVLTEGVIGVFAHTPQVLDLDRDGSLELLAFESSSMSLRCYDLGSMKEEWTIENEDRPSLMSPQPKVIVGHDASETRILLIMGPGTFVIFDGLGKELWRWKIENVDPTFPYLPSMSVADIDLDGDLEAVVASQKHLGLRRTHIGIDIFNLEPPTWVSKYMSYGDQFRIEGPVSPPFLVDIYPKIAGLEIVFASGTNGIRAVSSDDGSVLWHWDNKDDREWTSLGSIRFFMGLHLYACTKSEITVLNITSGQEFHVLSPYSTTFTDEPIVSYFEPRHFSQGLLLTSDRNVSVIDPWKGRQIWSMEFDDGVSIAKQVTITGRTGVTAELHIYAWNERTGEGSHVRYWSPITEDHHISVEPANQVIQTNADTGPAGITISGPTDVIDWVFLRLYQGRADDLMALARIRVGGGSSDYGFTRPNNVGVKKMTQNVEEDRIVQMWWWWISTNLMPAGDIHLQVTVILIDGTSRSLDAKDWLRWPEGLEILGEMVLTDENDWVVLDDEWVRGGSEGKLHGIVMAYNETGKPPPRDIVNITLRLEGSPAVAKIGPDGEITSSVAFPDTSGVFRILLEISVKWPPLKHVSNITLHIDAEPPDLIDYHPENGTWLASSHVVVGCTITDGDGSGIGTVHIQSWPEGGSPGDLVLVTDLVPDGTAIEARHTLSLGQGTWHYRWSASDAVSNGPTMGPVLTINVDLSHVVFDDFQPTDWVVTEEVEVSVVVRDVGGSGVNLQSIEYAYTTTGLLRFSPWMSVGLSGTASETSVVLTMDLASSPSNFVMFMASDVAGNARTSTAFQVRVDTERPTFQDPVPKAGEAAFNSTIIHCQIRVQDNLSGVDPGSVEFQYAVGEGFSEWTRPTTDASPGTPWTADVPKDLEGQMALRWRAKDIAGNGYGISELFPIRLNRPPVIESLEPISPIQIMDGRSITFIVEFTDPEGDDVQVRWTLDGEEKSRNSTFDVRFDPGEYEVGLVLDDGQGNVVEAIVIITSEDTPDYQVGGLWLWLMVIIVVIVIITAIAILKRSSR